VKTTDTFVKVVEEQSVKIAITEMTYVTVAGMTGIVIVNVATTQ